MNRCSVADYYDRRTARFLGPQAVGAETESLHRAVWGPGVITRSDALTLSERLIAERILRHAPTGPLWDLGCGVGAVTERIAAATGRAAFGLTISPVQARLARRAGRTVVCGDCNDRTALAALRQRHAEPPAAALEHLAHYLAPRGLVLVCDDVLLRDPATPREHALLGRWRRGWRLGRVGSTRSLLRVAADVGFVPLERRDLTPWLRLYRRRDALVALAAWLSSPLADSASWVGNLQGGAALTRLTRGGVVGYRLVVMQKRA